MRFGLVILSGSLPAALTALLPSSVSLSAVRSSEPLSLLSEEISAAGASLSLLAAARSSVVISSKASSSPLNPSVVMAIFGFLALTSLSFSSSSNYWTSPFLIRTSSSGSIVNGTIEYTYLYI